MNKYTIKGLKTFIGREGHGYNVNLHRDGIRVAFIIDHATGGEVDFQWLDRNGKNWVECEVTRWDGKPETVRMTPEEKLLREFLKGKMSPPCFPGDVESQMTPVEFVVSLITEHEVNQKLRKICKTKTAFRLVGDEALSYRAIPVVFTPKVKQNLLESLANQGKELAEIYNETLLEKEKT